MESFNSCSDAHLPTKLAELKFYYDNDRGIDRSAIPNDLQVLFTHYKEDRVFEKALIATTEKSKRDTINLYGDVGQGALRARNMIMNLLSDKSFQHTLTGKLSVQFNEKLIIHVGLMMKFNQGTIDQAKLDLILKKGTLQSYYERVKDIANLWWQAMKEGINSMNDMIQSIMLYLASHPTVMKVVLKGFNALQRDVCNRFRLKMGKWTSGKGFGEMGGLTGKISNAIGLGNLGGVDASHTYGKGNLGKTAQSEFLTQYEEQYVIASAFIKKPAIMEEMVKDQKNYESIVKMFGSSSNDIFSRTSFDDKEKQLNMDDDAAAKDAAKDATTKEDATKEDATKEDATKEGKTFEDIKEDAIKEGKSKGDEIKAASGMNKIRLFVEAYDTIRLAKKGLDINSIESNRYNKYKRDQSSVRLTMLAIFASLFTGNPKILTTIKGVQAYIESIPLFGTFFGAMITAAALCSDELMEELTAVTTLEKVGAEWMETFMNGVECLKPIQIQQSLTIELTTRSHQRFQAVYPQMLSKADRYKYISKHPDLYGESKEYTWMLIDDICKYRDAAHKKSKVFDAQQKKESEDERSKDLERTKEINEAAKAKYERNAIRREVEWMKKEYEAEKRADARNELQMYLSEIIKEAEFKDWYKEKRGHKMKVEKLNNRRMELGLSGWDEFWNKQPKSSNRENWFKDNISTIFKNAYQNIHTKSDTFKNAYQNVRAKSEETLEEKFVSENPESQRVESEETLGEKFDSENPESQRVESDDEESERVLLPTQDDNDAAILWADLLSSVVSNALKSSMPKKLLYTTIAMVGGPAGAAVAAAAVLSTRPAGNEGGNGLVGGDITTTANNAAKGMVDEMNSLLGGLTIIGFPIGYDREGNVCLQARDVSEADVIGFIALDLIQSKNVRAETGQVGDAMIPDVAVADHSVDTEILYQQYIQGKADELVAKWTKLNSENKKYKEVWVHTEKWKQDYKSSGVVTTSSVQGLQDEKKSQGFINELGEQEYTVLNSEGKPKLNMLGKETRAKPQEGELSWMAGDNRCSRQNVLVDSTEVAKEKKEFIFKFCKTYTTKSGEQSALPRETSAEMLGRAVNLVGMATNTGVQVAYLGGQLIKYFHEDTGQRVIDAPLKGNQWLATQASGIFESLVDTFNGDTTESKQKEIQKLLDENGASTLATDPLKGALNIDHVALNIDDQTYDVDGFHISKEQLQAPKAPNQKIVIGQNKQSLNPVNMANNLQLQSQHRGTEQDATSRTIHNPAVEGVKPFVTIDDKEWENMYLSEAQRQQRDQPNKGLIGGGGDPVSETHTNPDEGGRGKSTSKNITLKKRRGKKVSKTWKQKKIKKIRCIKN